MFLAAQIAQGTVTSRQIAQASAALAENARDPRVGPALKQRDALQRNLDRIYRALDSFGVSGATWGKYPVVSVHTTSAKIANHDAFSPTGIPKRRPSVKCVRVKWSIT